MRSLSNILFSLPFVFSIPIIHHPFSSISGSNFNARRVIGLPDNRHLPAPRPIPLPYGQQSCPNGNLMPLYWQESGPPKRSNVRGVPNDTQQVLTSTLNAMAPRQAGPVKPSPLCSMIAHFTFTNMYRNAATTIPIKLYPGLIYVFSIGCDVGLATVTTLSKNHDDSDPLDDWSVLRVKDYRHSTAGTMNLVVQEPTEVEFTVRFSFFGASGEIGLFQVNVT